MKKIFIYYSLSGNGDLVAEALSKNEIDIRKVRVMPKDELPKNTFFRIMTGGFLAWLQRKSELMDFNSDINEYDEIIIGSPVWNGRLSCPINTVLDKLDLKDKKVTFILYSGSGEAKNATKKINEMYGDEKIIHIKEPKKHEESTKEILKENKII